MGRDRLEIVRTIEPGRAVHRAANGLDQADVLGLRYVGRTLEHDVLKEVGKARLARDLVLRADRIPDIHRHNRGDMILGDDEPQAVGQALIGEVDGQSGHGFTKLQEGGWPAEGTAAEAIRGL